MVYQQRDWRLNPLLPEILWIRGEVEDPSVARQLPFAAANSPTCSDLDSWELTMTSASSNWGKDTSWSEEGTDPKD